MKRYARAAGQRGYTVTEMLLVMLILAVVIPPAVFSLRTMVRAGTSWNQALFGAARVRAVARALERDARRAVALRVEQGKLYAERGDGSAAVYQLRGKTLWREVAADDAALAAPPAVVASGIDQLYFSCWWHPRPALYCGVYLAGGRRDCLVPLVFAAGAAQ